MASLAIREPDPPAQPARCVSISVVSDAVGERELAWGEKLDVREIAAYAAKYAAKSADSSGALDCALFCRFCQGRGMTLTGHGTPLTYTACGGTGQARPLPRLAVERHVRQMIRTCWELGKRPEFADLKLWKWAHMLGFCGHFSTKSRC
ncbi:replication initiator [Kitasatospora sp. NPDC088783]|uniref:replication initiator n=1 Tax=Kitasatospora sp. NPDC088783 TaxID=3364077 RepID=UPI0037F587A3